MKIGRTSKICLILVSILSIGATAVGDTSTDALSNYYKISKATIQEVVSTSTDQEIQFRLPLGATRPTEVQELSSFQTAYQMIRIGRSLWQIVENNKPVVNTKWDQISVLPKGKKGTDQLSGWIRETPKAYRVLFENTYGMEVINFKYRIVYSYGGGLDGKGKYLANVSIYPAHLKVAWGYRFDASTLVPRAINLGTTEEPVAAIEMHLNYRVRTPISDEQNTISSFISGSGDFKIYH